MSETTTAAPAAPPEERVRELEAVLGRRIELVESENQRLRRLNRLALVGVAAALGVSAAVLVVSGTGRSALAAETVEAQRFVLRGPGGETRGEWRAGEAGASELVLQDAEGRTRIRLGMLPDGATGVSLSDAAGSSRVALGLLPDQTASLVFADRAGRTRSVLGYSSDDAVNLVFADRRGATRAGLGVDAAGQPSFTLLEDQPAAARDPEPPADEPEGAPAAGGTR